MTILWLLARQCSSMCYVPPCVRPVNGAYVTRLVGISITWYLILQCQQDHGLSSTHARMQYIGHLPLNKLVWYYLLPVAPSVQRTEASYFGTRPTYHSLLPVPSVPRRQPTMVCWVPGTIKACTALVPGTTYVCLYWPEQTMASRCTYVFY